MGVEIAAELRLLPQDEYPFVARSHHPAPGDVPRGEPAPLARWLRDRRARARDTVRGRRCVRSGKAEPRSAAEPPSGRGLSAEKRGRNVPEHRRGTTATLAVAALAAALLAAGRPTGAVAQGEGLEELNNLDIDMPNTLDDAFAAARGSVTLLGAARYDDRRRGHHDTVRLFPRLLVGVAEGLQLQVQVPYTVGSGPGDDRGTAAFGALYNLNRETAWLPAFAVSVEGGPAVGPGAHGGELRLFGIASKTVDPGAWRRLHLNVAWFRRFDPGEEERRDRHRVALGYSQVLAPRAVLVANYLRETLEERGERAANILEAGLRYQLSHGVVLGGAVGAGIGRDSPRFRAIASVQFGLSGGR